MSRKTIASYFEYLMAQGLITYNEKDEYYYLTTLERDVANLIEYHTLIKLTNTIQKDGISVYAYLLNRYIANSETPFVATMSQIKDYIGIATSTTSNNGKIDDILDILQRLQLINYKDVKNSEGKTMRTFYWVSNRLPD